MSAEASEVELLARMTYGESYYKENNYEEMAGIASVLVRQRDARGYATMKAFTDAEPSYSFVTNDGNKRFSAIARMSESDVDKKLAVYKSSNKLESSGYKLPSSGHPHENNRHSSAAEQKTLEGFKLAYLAARNSLAGGTDYSNGAYFWDGWDIKTNYANHPKVARGIKITSPDHNIFGIKDRLEVIIKYRVRTTTTNGRKSTTKEEMGRYDHVYESTAAKGGTIFWRFNPEYIKLERSKVFK